jgi:predicted nucleic acid-binding protein
MPARAFIDTNVLVYASETSASDARSDIARELLRSVDACISTQVLGEFYCATTSKRRISAFTHEEATAWIQFWKRYEVRVLTPAHVDLALEIVSIHKISYYDALILAAARLADCETVYSEDMNTDQDYGGVVVRNPFASSRRDKPAG